MKFIETEEYKRFTEKFKADTIHVKTTDDCYTPKEVYEVVFAHCVDTYGIDPEKVIRPFYPGGDYRQFDYTGGKVVIDNPPFSISSEIIDFYLENKIPFFLFNDGKTIFRRMRKDVRIVIIDVTVTYENSAMVNTSFVTNLAESGIEYNPILAEKIRITQKKKTRKKHYYPKNLICLGNYHSRLEVFGIFIPKKHLTYTQKAGDIDIYGGGCYLDEEGLALVEAAISEKTK